MLVGKRVLNDTEGLPTCDSSVDDIETDLPSKRQKCLSPETTVIESEEDNEGCNANESDYQNEKNNENKVDSDQNRYSSPTKGPTISPFSSSTEDLDGQESNPIDKQTIKELDKQEREKQKLEIRLQKQRQKEIARLEQEKKKQREKLERQQQKDLEKEEREKRREQEKIDREKKKEEERLAKERKKEEERIERDRKRNEERLEKERKKEEERLERERKKEEERIERERKKEEERIEREKKKEEERLERERRKEEERLKKEEEKERGQRKISSFFSSNQKKLSTKTDNTATSEDSDVENKLESAYDVTFLPFFKKKTTIMPMSRQLSVGNLKASVSKFDSVLGSPYKANSKEFFKSNRVDRDNSNRFVSPDDINGALNSSEATESKIYEMLQRLPPIKYLQFYENSKPPYIGTWCSNEHIRIRFPILNPFDTSATGFDYAYDSDLDWNGEEEGDGEDIDDDDDDDDEPNDLDEEDEDMDDFVEEGTNDSKMKKFLGPLTPVCQWNNDNSINASFCDLKYEKLHLNIDFAIDPFFNYWGSNSSTANINGKATYSKSTLVNSDEVSSIANNTHVATNILTPQKPTIKDQKVIYDLIKFIEANKDKNYSIGTLTELSKNEERFKGFTKSLLKHTIQDIASYNKSTSHWEVKPETKEMLAKIYG